MVLPLLTEERAEYLLANVPPYPLETPVLQMTLGEYFVATTEGFTERLLKEKRAYKAFGRLRQLKSELESLGKWLKRFDVPMSADEQAAAANAIYVQTEVVIYVPTGHLTDYQTAQYWSGYSSYMEEE